MFDDKYPVLDEQNDNLDGWELAEISILVPKMHIEIIKDWLSNGERKSRTGLGLGVMKRCGLL